jgi:hypothetical protein
VRTHINKAPPPFIERLPYASHKSIKIARSKKTSFPVINGKSICHGRANKQIKCGSAIVKIKIAVRKQKRGL